MFQLFNTAIIHPYQNILVGFYKLFLSIGLPGAFGFAIITITLIVRAAMHPFFKQQMETAQKMKELKPHLDKLSKLYKGDSKKHQQEQMKLYQQAGINPASGCLFAIIQIPLLLGLYRTMQLFLAFDKEGKVVKQINDSLYWPFLHIQSIDPHFFGLNLALTPAKSGSWLFYLVPVITGGLQYLQTKVTMPQDEPKKAKSKDEIEKKDLKKDEKEKSSTSEDFQQAMNTQMKYFFPLMIGYFSYSLPLGLSLYWNIFSLFSIIQYHLSQKKTNSTHTT